MKRVEKEICTDSPSNVSQRSWFTVLTSMWGTDSTDLFLPWLNSNMPWDTHHHETKWTFSYRHQCSWMDNRIRSFDLKLQCLTKGLRVKLSIVFRYFMFRVLFSFQLKTAYLFCLIQLQMRCFSSHSAVLLFCNSVKPFGPRVSQAQGGFFSAVWLWSYCCPGEFFTLSKRVDGWCNVLYCHW